MLTDTGERPIPSAPPAESEGPVGVTISRLTERTCRWPLWADDARPVSGGIYCGAAVADGDVYCPHHRHRAGGRRTRDAVTPTIMPRGLDWHRLSVSTATGGRSGPRPPIALPVDAPTVQAEHTAPTLPAPRVDAAKVREGAAHDGMGRGRPRLRKTSCRSIAPPPVAAPDDHAFAAPSAGRFVFDTFAVAPSNALAFSAARSLSEDAPEISFRLLYIHGAPGLGKTHLLRAAGDLARRGGDQVALLSARDGGALPSGLVPCDLLLVDDVQDLSGGDAGRPLARQIMRACDAGLRIIVVADCPPAALDRGGPHLASRLKGGLVAEVRGMETDLRRAIIDRRLSDLFGAAADVVPDSVRARFADLPGHDGRNIEGAVQALHARWTLPGEGLTASALDEVMAGAPPPVPARVRLDAIITHVCRHYGFSRADLLSQRRTADVVRARQIAMYLGKTLTQRSLPEIGRVLGGRDHTTVLHAVRKLAGLVVQDGDFAAELEALGQAIRGGGAG